jgi:hypothetical protein
MNLGVTVKFGRSSGVVLSPIYFSANQDQEAAIATIYTNQTPLFAPRGSVWIQERVLHPTSTDYANIFYCRT